MKNQLKIFLVVFIALFFPQCDLFENDDNKLLPLDSKILFDVIETHHEYTEIGEPEIFLSLVTEKEYPNFNYSISNYLQINGNTITIYINGIYIPSILLPALGPAHSMIKLDLVNGYYNLQISYKDFSDEYNLKVNDSSLTLNGKPTADTEQYQNIFWRFPEKSFVYLCGTTQSDSGLCDEFLDTLHSTLQLTEFQFPDSGKIPYPNFSNGHYYDMPAKYFIYQTENDFDRIEEVLTQFKQNQIGDKQGIGISIINWLNKKLYSWAL
ncbi:MAG: hypothetical protein Q7S39_03530 [Ignavibacteria bacterium]|nr:hypothetical protein [Ignavibacteria bacterium]